jgi:hypothetical protein
VGSWVREKKNQSRAIGLKDISLRLLLDLTKMLSDAGGEKVHALLIPEHLSGSTFDPEIPSQHPEM